ncbi:MAG: carbohydrate kinase [Saprospiraceae bacterium]|nr:carbohydrate kinase [Saprospiraceae bacterium]
MKKPTVVCFGEVLWDMLPTGKVAGGAPMNVAYHLNNLGVESLMISQVGADDLGKELLAFLQTKGLTIDFIQVVNEHPTSTVQVKLNESGSPTYTIVENVAWDAIDFDAANYSTIESADALVYGSLAARKEQTRNTLLALLKLAKLKVLDLNLRKPFYSFELLQPLLYAADIVKLSDEELVEIATNQQLAGHSELQLLQLLKEKYHCKGLC